MRIFKGKFRFSAASFCPGGTGRRRRRRCASSRNVFSALSSSPRWKHCRDRTESSCVPTVRCTHFPSPLSWSRERPRTARRTFSSTFPCTSPSPPRCTARFGKRESGRRRAVRPGSSPSSGTRSTPESKGGCARAETENGESGASASAAAGEKAERGGSSSLSAILASTLAPLPASRQEVEAIASLYPGQSVSYLGSSATETRAKSLGRSHRYVHFACHAVMDRRFPLDSGLALSSPAQPKPGEDNGLLQAWEIFESVRLDADLVTLSACESGLGAELPGEGLQSLARAFQFAGARSVLASLWTGGRLDLGHPHDSFLCRAAKRDRERPRPERRAAVAHPRVHRRRSHPFFWAGFELIGDWR